jgi:hypothetical protein
MANGAVSVTFEVCQDFYDFFASNPKGVYQGNCLSSSPNHIGGHAVALIGWGSDQGGYWLLANQWATWWADGGYFRMAYTSSSIMSNPTGIKFGGSRRRDEESAEETEQDGITIDPFTPGPDVLGGGLVKTLPADSPLLENPVKEAVNAYSKMLNKQVTLSSVRSGTSQVTNGVTFGVSAEVVDENGVTYQLDSVVQRGLDGTYQVVSNTASPITPATPVAAAASTGLSSGVVAGIAAGAAGLAALVTAAVAVTVARIRNRRNNNNNDSLPPPLELEIVTPRRMPSSGGVDLLSPKSTRVSITARAPPTTPESTTA